jgi:hypothetical protein
MWKGVSSMRGAVANKARDAIADSFGLTGMKREDIADAVDWMLKDLKKVRKGEDIEDDISLPFICGDLDIKVSSTYIWSGYWHYSMFLLEQDFQQEQAFWSSLLYTNLSSFFFR